MKKFFIIIAAIFAMTSIASIVSAQTYTFNSDLTLGSSGPDVTNLQTWLISNGYNIPAISSGVAGKGYFGSQTRDAVAAYQRTLGLPAYGYFGQLTRGRLNGSYGQNNSLRVISPNGGESWQKGAIQTIRWTSPYYFRATTASINLQRINSPCATQMCPMVAYAPYSIAIDVPINQNSYTWKVGEARSFTADLYDNVTVPDGQYTIQVCETGSSNCDSSNSSFNIYSSISNNQPPVINGVDAPTTLAINQTGTWTIRASDPQQGTLSYSVDWGDALVASQGYQMMPLSTEFDIQSSTFTHSYSRAGTYIVAFTVRNNGGFTARTSSTVMVGSGLNQPTVTITSPNGGEVWQQGTTRPITWYLTGGYNNQNTRLDLDLGRKVQAVCPAGYSCIPLPYDLLPFETMYVLDRNIAANATYNWIVGTDISNNSISPGSYVVRACVAGSTTNCDTSNSEFTVTSNIPDLSLCPIGYTCTKM